MEVKPGYKQTTVGVIPEDWEVAQLGELKPFVTSGSRGWASFYSDRGSLFVRITNLSRNSIYLDLTDSKFVKLPPEASEGVRTQLNKHDILISITADIGIVGYVDESVPSPAYINQHIALVRFDASRVSGKFVSYFLSSERPQRLFRAIADVGAKAGMSLTTVQKVQTALPPFPEQHAIATALSDMDALLDGLDHLIAKKRAIKQATMQQLLTGQTRLPGFSGEWEMRRLGDHLSFLRNGVNSRAELSNEGDVRYLHYGEIHGAECLLLNPIKTPMPRLPEMKAKGLDRLKDGDLIFADASEDLDGVGKAVEIQCAEDIEVVSGLHTIAARFDKSVLADGFKAYIQFIPSFRAHLRQLAAGTKVYATNRAHITSVEMELPGVKEQAAITAVLSDMDTEITALEARRTKTHALKQAMMQELLTGRTRLVEPGAKQPIEKEVAQAEGRKANVYFLRSVLAAEIIDQLHDQPTFGHVKFEKMMFLVEHLCDVDTGSTYHRKAAGPYDNRALRSIDSQLQKQQWFDVRKEDGRYRYVPMAKRGAHKQYFDRHFSSIGEAVGNILATFKTAKTEQCEIVATLLAAWNDLLREKGAVSDEVIVHEVLNNWHESKQRIPEERWLKALGWMREKDFVPKSVISP